MSLSHYARDAIQNPLNSIHQRCTWPMQCAVCSNPDNHRAFEFFFARTTDSDDHFLCCIPLIPPASLPNDNSEVDSAPVVFTVICQIAPEECFLTAAGDEREDRPDPIKDRPLASCWLESRPDRDSCVEWRQIPSAIERVASTAIAGPLNTSRLLRFMPNDGAVQLRIRFVPYEGVLADTLPFFDTRARGHGVRRIVPNTLDEVPFDTPFRASFTLEYFREGDEKYMYADLVTLETL